VRSWAASGAIPEPVSVTKIVASVKTTVTPTWRRQLESFSGPRRPPFVTASPGIELGLTSNYDVLGCAGLHISITGSVWGGETGIWPQPVGGLACGASANRFCIGPGRLNCAPLAVLEFAKTG
jgi:hypothetical protein